MTSRGWALFGAVSVLWGIPYLFIGIALREGMPPLVIVACRVALGALILVPLTMRSGLWRLIRDRWQLLAMFAAVEVIAPFTLIAVGEQTVSSAVAGVLIATEPLFVLVLGRWLGGGGRLTWRAGVGLLVGFIGVVVLLGVRGAGPGAVLVLVAAACYALGALLVARWFSDVPTRTVVAGMLLLASAPLLTVTLAVAPVTETGAGAWPAILALGIACTAGGFSAFFALIAEAGPARAALITYVAPIVAVAAGAALLGEEITARSIGGIVLILVGAALATHLNIADISGGVPDISDRPSVRE